MLDLHEAAIKLVLLIPTHTYPDELHVSRLAFSWWLSFPCRQKQYCQRLRLHMLSDLLPALSVVEACQPEGAERLCGAARSALHGRRRVSGTAVCAAYVGPSEAQER